MIENTLEEYLKNRTMEISNRLYREQKQDLEDRYYRQYIANYENTIQSLDDMFAKADPFMKIRIIGAIKENKKQLGNITRQYNQILRQRQARRKNTMT